MRTLLASESGRSNCRLPLRRAMPGNLSRRHRCPGSAGISSCVPLKPTPSYPCSSSGKTKPIGPLERCGWCGRQAGHRFDQPSDVALLHQAYTNAATGSVYVGFQIAADALRAAGNGWGKIYGPNSIFAQKLGITEMPRAIELVIKATKP